MKNGKVKVLIYDEQTVSPVTTRIIDEAKALSIPTVPIVGTLPSRVNYQSWMWSQLTVLDRALRN